MKCDYCSHVEMCRWRKEVNEDGCEFYDDGNRTYERIDRLLRDLGISCAYDMPSFWAHDKKGKSKYVVIPDKYHNGYQKAIGDVDKGIKEIFGKNADDATATANHFYGREGESK